MQGESCKSDTWQAEHHRIHHQQGYVRPEPGQGGGAERKRRRSESKNSAMYEKEVGGYVRTARKRFTTHPTHFPQRGTCLMLSVAATVLFSVLFYSRPDLLSLPVGQWATDGFQGLGVSLWFDARKFPTSLLPPFPLKRTW